MLSLFEKKRGNKLAQLNKSNGKEKSKLNKLSWKTAAFKNIEVVLF